MNSVSRKLICMSAFALLAGAAATAGAAPVDCARTNDFADKKACAAAAQGVAELRQYIQRTRNVYILYIHDFQPSMPAPTASRDAPAMQAKAG